GIGGWDGAAREDSYIDPWVRRVEREGSVLRVGIRRARHARRRAGDAARDPTPSGRRAPVAASVRPVRRPLSSRSPAASRATMGRPAVGGARGGAALRARARGVSALRRIAGGDGRVGGPLSTPVSPSSAAAGGGGRVDARDARRRPAWPELVDRASRRRAGPRALGGDA